MSTALELVDRTRRGAVKIAVIGDAMRDEHVHGQAERFSQEAPVPILLTDRDEPLALPGGAGNVAYQFRHWNAEVKLLGLLDDETAAVMARHAIDTSHSVALPTGANPIKRRLYAGDHILLRHDAERPDYGEPDVAALREQLLDRLRSLLDRGLDAVVLSDYGKGLFDYKTIRAVINACNAAGVISVVDPKGRHPTDYAGCTAFKPNWKYLRERGGPFDHPGILYWFKKVLAPTPALVCTRGDKPPIGYHGGPDRDRATDFTGRDRGPVTARSVIGAGDCFIAHLALALAHRLPVPDAAEVAFSAGRVYVQHPHNRPVMPHEVHADQDPAGAKILTPAELKHVLDARHPAARTVFTNGCFDLTHAGHAGTLQWAKDRGDVLVVGINTDESVRGLKGPDRPVLTLDERARMVAALGCVDYVVPFAEPTPEPLIANLKPRVLVKGPDNSPDRVPGRDLVTELLIAPPTAATLHAADIIARVRSRESI